MSYVFHADNAHIDECGLPPSLAADLDNVVSSYFENHHGEQMVFQYRRDPTGWGNVAHLFHGDTGWDESHQINIDGNTTGDLILNSEEKTWLTACIMVARERRDAWQRRSAEKES
jgi:hypothetical protein